MILRALLHCILIALWIDGTAVEALTSAESENEPASHQMTVLASALKAAAASGIPELTPRFDAEEATGYYIKEAEFIGRVATPLGHRTVVRLKYIRSSPYRANAVTPPRGHSFMMVLDDDMHYVSHQRSGSGVLLYLKGTKVFEDDTPLFDLAALEPTPSTSDPEQPER